MNYLLVAHGTRKSKGVNMIGRLAERVSGLLDNPVHVAFVDVLGPTPSEVLRALPANRPVTVVPAFLTSGYHVRVDLPAHVDSSGHRATVVTRPLGPCVSTVQVLAQRLVECGWRPGDSVVLAAAGTSDPFAQSDLRQTAATLSATIGDRVELAYAATGAPRVADAVQTLRRGGAERVVMASYLLAEGLFQDRLRSSGADLVAAPLGDHPAMARLIANRFKRARVPQAA
ncbi:sirohydrochlorin chelatase [Mycolicibacterium sp. 120270]|uniref:sirohydrochlorin chelatase n=1 Tax=Mycolicibacterium sp. 120270 TaxID=3090600 RepID=UPI00299D8CC9|nr:sirohydrochlorin chelatase [Mycolicibacterium sp. 120270]MDX1885769.1 sirohydrochlorin chelatase [Mycolicibacterium sp. 120270]